MPYLPDLTSSDHAYFILQLNVKREPPSFRYYGFAPSEFAQATKEAERLERELSGEADVVLVTLESIHTMREAYPNYFVDLHDFAEVVFGTGFNQQ